MSSKIPKAYVVAVTMGYGHLRPAYALRDIAQGGPGMNPGPGVISADDYPDIPPEDKKIWETLQQAYNFISRFKRVPVLGDAVFNIMDHMQEIAGFYPRRDLTKPIWQLRATYNTIKKKKWGKHLIDTLNKRPLPLVTTFFTIAHMAEYWGYKGKIYCVVTDTDISRSWVALKPSMSKIFYCAPSHRVVDRLKLYGVNPKQIYLTGFPLPKENLDPVRGKTPKTSADAGRHRTSNGIDHGESLEVLRHDMAHRMVNLDPAKRYLKVHGNHVAERLGLKKLPSRANHPLTITFAVGGAGAQREIGVAAMQSLRRYILQERVRINLIAGIHEEVRDYFVEEAGRQGLRSSGGLASAHRAGIHVQFSKTKAQYLKEFNKLLRTTDILWTKPSELSFFAALGLPIIIAPPIGSQEEYNKGWLLALDAGIPQEDPEQVAEWLFDWLNSGFLAKAAMAGYREGFKFGTFNIERLVAGRPDQMKLVETVSPY